MSSIRKQLGFTLMILLVISVILTACGTDTPTTAPTVAPAATATTAAKPTTAPATATVAAATATTAAKPTTAPATATVAAPTATTAAEPTAASTGSVKQFGDGKPMTLTIWTHDLKGNPTFEKYLTDVWASYMKLHPNITVKWEDVAGTDLKAKLASAIAAGNAPDVVNLNTDFSLTFASQGLLEDVNPIITPEQKGQYFEPLYHATKIGAADYNVPWYVVGFVTFINKDIFTKAGLDPVKDAPKSFDDAAKIAQVIHDKSEAYAFEPINGFSDEAVMEGFPMLSADHKKASFNTPEAKAKLDYYYNLKKADLVPAKIGLVDENVYDDAVKNYESGKLAMLLSGGSLINQVEKDAPDVYKNTIVAPFLLGKAGKVPVSLQGFSIPKGSKNKEAAVDLATFVTNDENQLAFCHLATILPSTVKAAKDPFFQAAGDEKQHAKTIMVDQFPISEDSTVSDAHSADLNKALNANLTEWWAGTKTSEQALTDAAAEWDKILATEPTK